MRPTNATTAFFARVWTTRPSSQHERSTSHASIHEFRKKTVAITIKIATNRVSF